MRKRNSEQDRLGDIGEKYFEKSESANLPSGVRLIDVSDNDTLENFHVDFVVADKDVDEETVVENIISKSYSGIKTMYEVKTDTEILTTRNMYFEVSSSPNKMGWAFTTVADYLIYYGIDKDDVIREGWKINIDRFRSWFLDVHRLPKGGKWNGKCKTAIFKSAGRDKNSWLTNVDELVENEIAEKIEITKHTLLDKFFSVLKGNKFGIRKIMALTGYGPSMDKKKELGQIFTNEIIVNEMLSLRKNNGRALEPSCGGGAFYDRIPDCVGIELDRCVCPKGALCMDFFDYPVTEKFDTIIGNPPYVQYKFIEKDTKSKLDMTFFNEKANLYLFFIKKCVNNLNPNGELIFIVPRELQKVTSARKLNEFLYANGSFKYIRETGDDRIFSDASPNCIIFRYVKGDMSHVLDDGRVFNVIGGNIVVSSNVESGITLQDIATVKVGEVSGCDEIFSNEEYGNKEFVCSQTRVTNETRKMIYEEKVPYLYQYKDKLLERKAKPFDEKNWWTWVRTNKIGNEPRVYVNGRTRIAGSFFLHPCCGFDGSVLGIFPKKPDVNLEEFRDMLNGVDWESIGFKSGGRYLFTQKSLSNAPLPDTFKKYLVD